jgi:hypothetical protein
MVTMPAGLSDRAMHATDIAAPIGAVGRGSASPLHRLAQSSTSAPHGRLRSGDRPRFVGVRRCLTRPARQGRQGDPKGCGGAATIAAGAVGSELAPTQVGGPAPVRCMAGSGRVIVPVGRGQALPDPPARQGREGVAGAVGNRVSRIANAHVGALRRMPRQAVGCPRLLPRTAPASDRRGRGPSHPGRAAQLAGGATRDPRNHPPPSHVVPVGGAMGAGRFRPGVRSPGRDEEGGTTVRGVS